MAGCGAHLCALRRTQAGAFTLDQAITIDELKTLTPEAVESRLAHPRTLLREMPCVTINEQTAGRIRNGMQVNLPEFSQAPMVKVFTTPTELLAIVRRVAGTLMQPVVVMG